MLFPNARYEIEFRCYFDSNEEAYRFLPFLKASLKFAYTWFDNYHGLKVFQSGQVLRESGTSSPMGDHYYLGWKGRDQGRFANLRREYNEETTGQITNSAILDHFCQLKGSFTPSETGPALDRAGYTQFMSYHGDSQLGRDETLGVNTKLMHCPDIRWPILVELEKLADSRTEADECQRQLEEISRTYRLESHLVKEEPGTLLYQKTFGKNG